MASERQLGRTADFPIPTGVIVQVKIGNDIAQGSALTVTRYRTYGGREIYRLELVDAIVIEERP